MERYLPYFTAVQGAYELEIEGVIGKLLTSWLAYELAGDDGPLYGRGEQIYGLAGWLYGIIYEWSHLVGSFHYSLFDSASFCVEWGSYLYVRIQSHHT